MKTILFIFIGLSYSSVFAYYPESYENSRKHFLETTEKLKDTFPQSQVHSLPIPTNTEQSLTIETFYIPQKNEKKERLLILTSGIHGVEAFTGSAIQFAFMERLLKEKLLENMGILIVHAVNPYGYAFHRRVSENNVDLNRNFTADQNLFSSNNEAYAKLNKLLNPTDTLKVSFFNEAKLFCKSIFLLIRYGKASLTQAVVGGQYQFEKGISYGGKKPEPNVEILTEEFKNRGHSYKSVFHIDLHTGYGERGKLHYFINQSTIEKAPLIEKIFEGYELDTEKKKDFYKTSGDFGNFALQLFPDKMVIPMVFELGTMDSQTIMGSFLSLKNMIYENQGFHHGYADSASKTAVQQDFLNMFNPKGKNWRANVIKKTLRALEDLTGRYSELNVRDAH